MIRRYGIIKVIERLVNRKVETVGYTGLAEVGMQDKAFEAVVLRHPEVFSPETIQRSAERLQKWVAGATDSCVSRKPKPRVGDGN